MKNKEFLEQLFRIGAKRCHPEIVLKNAFPDAPPKGQTIILGAGKAAAEMAAVAAKCIKGEIAGAVVTRYGHGASQQAGPIKILEAGHPVPDANSLVAAQTMLALADKASADDRVIFLISGGGSALLTCPVKGISLNEKQKITESLLLSGAPIADINLVRKHLSEVKGGRLASRAEPAQLLTLVISDVVGDAPADVASGPSIAASSTPAQALKILTKYKCPLSASAREAVLANTPIEECAGVVKVVAKAADALKAIAQAASDNNWKPVMLGDQCEGDARATGVEHARQIRYLCSKPGRYALISGGELTVQVRNPRGRGGPNQEYLAGLLSQLDTRFHTEAIACDSDGIDGSEDNAGAYISNQSLANARARGLNIHSYLDDNNTYELFSKLNDLIITGPTGTNVNDIRIVLVDSRGIV